jgi:hypothetical protein
MYVMITGMKRATVRLPEELHEACARRLFDRASAWRNSFAPHWRKRIASGKPRAETRDPLANVKGIVHDGKLSAGIDEALYGN